MWAQLFNASLGIWLICSPAVLHYGNPARDNARITGPIAAAVAVIACSAATRSVRLVNLPIGLWLLAAPWLLRYPQTDAILNSLAVGFTLAALSLVRGKPSHSVGGGWPSLFQHQPSQAKTSQSEDQDLS